MSEEAKRVVHEQAPYTSVELHRSAKGGYYWTVKVTHAESGMVAREIYAMDLELRARYGVSQDQS